MERIRVLRIIARLNMGGPAIQAITLTRDLAPERFTSLLATGQCAPGEEEMSALLAEKQVEPVRIPGLGRAPSARDDMRALFHLGGLIRRFRPHVVHTHTAKAGALGRLAAALQGVPVRVHTFHGHVFRGYFSPLVSRAVIEAERWLGKLAHRVIAISETQRRELGEVYRIAPPQKIALVPLGFDLSPFLAVSRGEVTGTLRQEIGAAPDDLLVGIVGRIAPIKNHPLFVRAFARALASEPRLRAVIIGGGPPEAIEALTKLASSLGVKERLHLIGYRSSLAPLYADLDMVASSSENEGTPVALIEALAAGIPCLATRVGGVPDVLGEGRYGLLVPPGDEEAFARALLDLAKSPSRRAHLRALGPEAASGRYSFTRLCRDIEQLYESLLAR